MLDSASRLYHSVAGFGVAREGCKDSSRWSQTTGKRSIQVGTLKGCQPSYELRLAGSGILPGCERDRPLPEVSASLRPPATLWQPCGLQKSGGSFESSAR